MTSRSSTDTAPSIVSVSVDISNRDPFFLNALGAFASLAQSLFVEIMDASPATLLTLRNRFSNGNELHDDRQRDCLIIRTSQLPQPQQCLGRDGTEIDAAKQGNAIVPIVRDVICEKLADIVRRDLQSGTADQFGQERERQRGELRDSDILVELVDNLRFKLRGLVPIFESCKDKVNHFLTSCGHNELNRAIEGVLGIQIL